MYILPHLSHLPIARRLTESYDMNFSIYFAVINENEKKMILKWNESKKKK